MRTDVAPMVVASSGSHKVVGPSTEEKRTMIKQLTLFCTFAIFMAAFLGFSVSAFAGKECQDPDPRPKCNPGGGGDDHGDPPAQYCAQLISGGFDFGRETVTRNNRGNAYNSPDGLYMVRPLDSDSQAAWDAVFATCPILISEGKIKLLTVSDKWEIGNGGGKSAGEEGTPVSVSFKNAHSELYRDIEVDLHLRGVLPAAGFPTAVDETVEIELDVFWFYVHASGTDSCRISNKFSEVVVGGVDKSVLKMTWDPCSDE